MLHRGLILKVLAVLMILVFFASCGSPATPGSEPVSIPVSGRVQAAQCCERVFLPLVTAPAKTTPTGWIYVDHTQVGLFDSIPDATLTKARAIRFYFNHQSTGERIMGNGLQYLAGNVDGSPYPTSKYDVSKWTWVRFGSADFASKLTEFQGNVNVGYQNFDVMGMKFCYIDTYYQGEPAQVRFNAYRDMMLGLESKYPSKKFVWSTQALWSFNHTDEADIQAYNNYVRQYAQANKKIFFDLAAIESHDPNGTACKSGGNEILCSAYADDNLGHPNEAGSIRLAKGFWVLIAKLTGWAP